MLLCPDGMVGPGLTEHIQVGLDAWQENVVAAEDVQDVTDVKQVLFLKRVQGVVKDTRNTHEHITPEAFNSVLEENTIFF